MSPKTAHKWLLIVEADAQSDFDKLQPEVRQGVFRRLRELLIAENPLSLPFVEMLQAKQFERIRKFRVGDFRIFFSIDPNPVIRQKFQYKGTLFLIVIKNRKDAY
jgi:mRNA-degrading endonuclease RelE of RelBE toxin-antitoxin system